MLRLWNLLKEIDAAGDNEEFEPVGRRREFLEADRTLDRALGVRPWEWSPIDIRTDEPPDWVAADPYKLGLWREGQARRQALEAAAGGQADG